MDLSNNSAGEDDVADEHRIEEPEEKCCTSGSSDMLMQHEQTNALEHHPRKASDLSSRESDKSNHGPLLGTTRDAKDVCIKRENTRPSIKAASLPRTSHATPHLEHSPSSRSTVIEPIKDSMLTTESNYKNMSDRLNYLHVPLCIGEGGDKKIKAQLPTLG